MLCSSGYRPEYTVSGAAGRRTKRSSCADVISGASSTRTALALSTRVTRSAWEASSTANSAARLRSEGCCRTVRSVSTWLPRRCVTSTAMKFPHCARKTSMYVISSVDQHRGGAIEILQHRRQVAFGETARAHGLGHVVHPRVPFVSSDLEGRVAHAQPRMASGPGECVGAAKTLNQEVGQVFPRLGQVIRV